MTFYDGSAAGMRGAPALWIALNGEVFPLEGTVAYPPSAGYAMRAERAHWPGAAAAYEWLGRRGLHADSPRWGYGRVMTPEGSIICPQSLPPEVGVLIEFSDPFAVQRRGGREQ